MKDEPRGSFETPVSFELMWKTVYAWIRGATIKHKNVKLQVKDDPL